MNMLRFPKKIKIKILEGNTQSPIKIENIIISIHFFALKKNDYYLGPFFSDINGEIEIDANILSISAEAELQTGLMDYLSVNKCSPLVEIHILSNEEIENLIKGRMLWGIIGRERELYKSKEELLDRIQKNGNRFVLPQSLRVNWDESAPTTVSYALLTNFSKE
jgi:hypothetical protein